MDMKKKLSTKGEAKLNVLKDLRKMASDSMADGIKGIRTVKVSAPDKEGLKKGLKIAEELTDKPHDEDSELEKMEEVLGKDLDGDEEEGESEEHKEDVLGEEEEETEEEEESPEDLDKKIEELLKKKQALKMKA